MAPTPRCAASSERPNARAARYRLLTLLASTLSSGAPKAELRDDRTSTHTSISGGPGSSATMSISSRAPVFTLRATTRQPTWTSHAAATSSPNAPRLCRIVGTRPPYGASLSAGLSGEPQDAEHQEAHQDHHGLAVAQDEVASVASQQARPHGVPTRDDQRRQAQERDDADPERSHNQIQRCLG